MVSVQVRGWLSKGEADRLYELALGKVVLEIGSYCGRSTLEMSRGAALVVSVDWHLGDLGSGFDDTLGEFWKNIRDAKVENIVPVVAVSACTPIFFGKAWADLAFIDGAHDTESVKTDLDVAIGCLKSGGLIAMHDSHYPSVQRAVEEKLQEWTDREELAVDSLKVFQFPV